MAGEFWRVTIFGNGGNANTQSVLHFEKNAGIESAEVVCNIIDVDYCQYARSRIWASGTTILSVKAECPTNPNISPFIKGLNQGNTAGTNFCPTQCAVVWNLFSGFSGGSKRGRIFQPFIPFAHITNGVLNSIGLAQHNSVIAQVLSRFGGANPASGLRLVVRSRKLDSQTNVNTIGATSVIGTLRTRRVGVGF